jgi:hypothetical protein
MAYIVLASLLIAVVATLGLLIAILTAINAVDWAIQSLHKTLRELLTIEQEEQAHRAKIKSALTTLRSGSGREALAERLARRVEAKS